VQNEKIVKTGFEAWFNSQISLTERNRVKALILSHFNISEATFWRRLQDPQQFTPVEREFIATLAGKPVTELFD
jgi:hypothetical protein